MVPHGGQPMSAIADAFNNLVPGQHHRQAVGWMLKPTLIPKVQRPNSLCAWITDGSHCDALAAIGGC